MAWLERLIDEGADALRLRTDLEYFAETALKLRTKSGDIQPFIFNAAQKKLHTLLEEQKAKTGKVRAVVLKSRQLGISTYIAARYFHKVIHNPGQRCLIVGHERRASSNLFGIVRRFYDCLPETLRPSLGVSNTEELIFDKIDSGYLVSVASGAGAGRSATSQMLHASEAAFWDDLPTQFAGLVQTVADVDGSELILESTANGWNSFHGLWRKAESRESEFLPVFLPWFIDPDYRKKTDADFTMDQEEKTFAELYGLDQEQIAWRRGKIAQLNSPDLFKQEYPSTASEAFISSSFDSFIAPELVMKARREDVEIYGPLVIGVDPAYVGGDRTAIAWRRGHRILKVESRRDLDTMQCAGWIAKIIKDEKPLKVYLDTGGLGIGIYDRLVEQGHRNVVAVNFGSKPIEPPPLAENAKDRAGGPANRRSEMWQALKKKLEAGRFQLPDSDALQADLTSVGYRYDSSGRLLLESKQDMRRRGMPSPDEGDAVALTFAEPSGFPRGRNFNQDLRERYQGLYI